MARLLVVEDHPAVAALFTDVLTSAAHEVTVVHHGEQALTTLATAAFDLMLTDLRMPGMDGLTLIEAVRERDKELPILALSGDPGLLALVPADSVSGARDKPIDPDDLLEWIADTLRSRR